MAQSEERRKKLQKLLEAGTQWRAKIWADVHTGVDAQEQGRRAGEHWADAYARAEAQERSREAEEQSRAEIERERSRRPPDPPDPPDPPPRHGPLGQPVIDRGGTYL